MAEREGFEPPIRLPVCRISSAVLSTTQPPLRMPAFGEHPAHTMPLLDAQAHPRNAVSRTRGYFRAGNSRSPFRLTGGRRPLYSPPHAAMFCGPCGGIGRRARLKIEFRKECWFESGQGHHHLSKPNRLIAFCRLVLALSATLAGRLSNHCPASSSSSGASRPRTSCALRWRAPMGRSG